MEIAHPFVIVILIISIILMNFSFATSKRITISGFSPLDGELRFDFFNLNTEHAVRAGEIFIVRGADSCQVSTHFYGFGWQKRTRYPVTEVKIELRDNIEFVLPSRLVLESRTKKEHKDFRLRFMAVSAPFWVSSANNPESYRLDSRTPFSMQNAVRLGAKSAIFGDKIWGKSNWSYPELLRDSVFLLNYQDEDTEYFETKLMEVKPQILFLGFMTLSFPGAVHLASIAKKILGDKVFVVLGGKHVNETIYLKNGSICHHNGSPTLLMQQNRIPKVFDLVVSGDGEEVIHQIGEGIGKEIMTTSHIKSFSKYADSFQNLRGKFILSWIQDGEVKSFSGKGLSLEYNSLPSPVSLFGINTNFPVFGTESTAHVYSDMGKGCVLDCFFCSERNTVNGKVFADDPALRLYNQLQDAALSGNSVSAFVEDSILLTGNASYLNRLADLLETQPLGISFGGQFTVDNLIDLKVEHSIIRLAKCGLSYIYTGMETFDETIATSFSKNTKRKSSWVERNVEAMKFLSEHGIKYGVALLWGLGESQEERIQHLDFLYECKNLYGIPVVCSLNWATQHPLFNQSSFDYFEWGTARNSEYLPVLVRMFGEASEKYSQSKSLPTIAELLELEQKFEKLSPSLLKIKTLQKEGGHSIIEGGFTRIRLFLFPRVLEQLSLYPYCLIAGIEKFLSRGFSVLLH